MTTATRLRALEKRNVPPGRVLVLTGGADIKPPTIRASVRKLADPRVVGQFGLP